MALERLGTDQYGYLEVKEVYKRSLKFLMIFPFSIPNRRSGTPFSQKPDPTPQQDLDTFNYAILVMC